MSKLTLPRALTYGSVLIYSVALFLPSYRFTTPDKSVDFHHVGVQSIFESVLWPIPNLLYFALVYLHLSGNGTRQQRKAVATAILLFLPLAWFSYMFGDPMPGSIVRIGPAAPLWV